VLTTKERQMGDLSDIFDTFSRDDEDKSKDRSGNAADATRSDPKAAALGWMKKNPIVTIAAVVVGLAVVVAAGVLVFKYVGTGGIKEVMDALKTFQG
jgi:hypothetical protein